MKVFLSWSGDRSKYIAETFRDWLPMVIQALDPWISVDIAKGQKWTEELGKALKESTVCILCLTKDNIYSPYMHYEAGAIGANDNSTNCTFLFDVDENTVKYPLSAFQNTKFEKEDIFKLILSISDSLTLNGHKPVKGDILQRTFELNWSSLESKLRSTPASDVETPKRTSEDMIEEVLNIVRRIDKPLNKANSLSFIEAQVLSQVVKDRKKHLEANGFDLASAITTAAEILKLHFPLQIEDAGKIDEIIKIRYPENFVPMELIVYMITNPLLLRRN